MTKFRSSETPSPMLLNGPVVFLPQTLTVILFLQSLHNLESQVERFFVDFAEIPLSEEPYDTAASTLGMTVGVETQGTDGRVEWVAAPRPVFRYVLLLLRRPLRYFQQTCFSCRARLQAGIA